MDIMRLSADECATDDTAREAIANRILPELYSLDKVIFRHQVATERTKSNSTVLHLLCEAAYSLELIRYVVEEGGADIHARKKDASTPLTCCATHGKRVDERVSIIRYLTGRGAHVDARFPGGRKETELMDMCQYAKFRRSVRWLLYHGADPNAEDANGRAPLSYAICHTEYAADFVAMLVNAGADINKDLDVSKFIYTNLDRMSVDVLWAALRAGDTSVPLEDTITKYLPASTRPEVWRLFAREAPNMRRHCSGDTYLHLALQVNDAAVLSALMREWCNPLLKNRAGKRAAQLDARIAVYARWTPCVQRTRWYGPAFARTAFAFCRSALRAERRLPHDVQHLILASLAEELVRK